MRLLLFQKHPEICLDSLRVPENPPDFLTICEASGVFARISEYKLNFRKVRQTSGNSIIHTSGSATD